MKKLGVAIIGCGAIHGTHADAITESEYARLVAVADIKQDRAEGAAKKYNCEYYYDYKEMLANPEIDVVHICTPHYLHVPMAIDSLKASKHVLTEKPVAMKPEQTLDIIKAAQENDRYIAVCFQNRYNNTSIKAKEILEQGTAGKVLGIKGIVTWHRDELYYTQSGWRGKWDTEGGGVMINQAIHTLDLMQWLGGDIGALKGHTDTRVLQDVIEVEDTAEATLYYKNGAVGIFYATNAYITDSAVELEIVCENAILRINDGQLIMEKDGNKEYIIGENNELPKYKSYWGSSHRKLIEEFYEDIINLDSSRFISVKEATKALELIDAINKSSAKGKKIELFSTFDKK